MDTEDGRLFLKHLAFYIRTHEKALANSLTSQRQQRRHSTSSSNSGHTTDSWKAASQNVAGDDRPSTSGGLLSAFPLSRYSRASKPPRLFLTPNQLYYLLVRFEELGVNTGPLNIRVENLQNQPNSSNYMSFLAHAHSPSVRDTDADSIHSVVSVRSTMSSMSSLWSHFSLSGSAAARAEKQDAACREDMRYLYSAFTKIPCLKLSVDSRFRRIAGYEEFPFDTAIPIHAFKNLTEFEVSDIDFKSVFGWDRLADQLRVLIVKRASLDDLADLLTKMVLDDMDRRRRKSSKTPGTPISSFPPRNPFRRSGDWSQSLSASESPTPDKRPLSSGASRSPKRSTGDVNESMARHHLQNVSPQQPGDSQQRSFYPPQPRPSTTHRRASNSSTSSPPTGTPRQSSTNLSLYATLPPFKWRFLRHLSISDNSLTSLTAEALSPVANTLQSLDLSSNLFTEVPDCLSTLSALRALNLSNCMIESLRSLSQNPLPAITVLNIRANRISSLVGIEKLKSLQRLDARENRMGDPVEVARLTGMPDFFDIYVKNNPFTVTHGSYRVAIFNVFRAIPGNREDVTIDSSGPNYNERRHLIERAIEVASVPIVRPPFDDEPRQASAEEANSNSAFTSTDSNMSLPNPEPSAVKAAKKKGPKKRVVDLVESQAAKDLSSIAASPNSTGTQFAAASQMASGGQSALSKQKDISSINRASTTTLERSEDSAALMPSGGPDDTTDPKNQTDNASQSSYLYKKRIEALKNNRGNAWLTAIENIGSKEDPQKEALAKQNTVPHPFTPKTSPTIAASLEA